MLKHENLPRKVKCTWTLVKTSVGIVILEMWYIHSCLPPSCVGKVKTAKWSLMSLDHRKYEAKTFCVLSSLLFWHWCCGKASSSMGFNMFFKQDGTYTLCWSIVSVLSFMFLYYCHETALASVKQFLLIFLLMIGPSDLLFLYVLFNCHYSNLLLNFVIVFSSHSNVFFTLSIPCTT